MIFLAFALSAVGLAGLAWLDPKRKLANRGSTSRPLRLALLALVLLPGLSLAFMALAASFLVWLASVCATGWLLANFLSWRQTPARK